MLENECGTRYLEALGVRPCRATLEMVSKNMPLTESCVKVTLRVGGEGDMGQGSEAEGIT